METFLLDSGGTPTPVSLMPYGGCLRGQGTGEKPAAWNPSTRRVQRAFFLFR